MVNIKAVKNDIKNRKLNPTDLYRNISNVLETENCEYIKLICDYINTFNMYIEYTRICKLYIYLTTKNNLSILRYFIEKDIFLDEIAKSCCQYNKLDFLKYLKGLGCEFDTELLSTSCISGNLTLVKYIHSYLKEINRSDITDSISNSLMSGNKEVYYYMKKICPESFSQKYLLECAACGGNIELIEELMIDDKIDLAKYCAQYGKIDALKYCVEKGYHMENYDEIIEYMRRVRKWGHSHWECFYYLIELIPGKITLNSGEIDLQYFDIDHPHVRKYLFEDCSLPINMKVIIEHTKNEIDMRLRYIELRSNISSDLIWYIIKSFL